MKARNVFGLIVRTVGVFIILLGLWHLAAAIFETYLSSSRIVGYFFPYDPLMSFLLGVPSLLVGVALLRFARQIVRFSYPTNKDDDDA
jgi:hypothetical protein